jgi:hypothetical protein
MGEVGVRDSADRVVAVLRDAGRDEYTVRRCQVVLDRFAAFLTGCGVDTARELVCIDFIANQTGVRLAALHKPVKDRMSRPFVVRCCCSYGSARGTASTPIDQPLEQRWSHEERGPAPSLH